MYLTILRSRTPHESLEEELLLQQKKNVGMVGDNLEQSKTEFKASLSPEQSNGT